MSHGTQNRSSGRISDVVQLSTLMLYTVLTCVSKRHIIVRVKEEESSIHEFVFKHFSVVLKLNLATNGK